METRYGILWVGNLDFTDVEVRIESREDALALLNDMIEATTMTYFDVALEALRDAIERGII